MKSPEQIGEKPEQPEDESMENKEKIERKLTTPEEAAEMTRQRRKKYGLGESSDLTPEKLQEIEAAVGELLERLNEYDFDSFSPEVQDEWYWVEQEATVGKDRELAKAVLERFLSALKGSDEKKI